MFRIQDLVPEVYPNQSRDFQLFCRLYDIVFNSTKRSIDSMQHTSSTLKCDARLLPLLKTKVGFFSDVEVDDKDLRKILVSFPHIIKYKGSRKSINYIINLYSRLFQSTGRFINIRQDNSNYVIEVYSDTPVQKTELLVELLRYVIPAGYTVDYYSTKEVKIYQTVKTNSVINYSKTESFESVDGSIKTRYVSKVVIRKDSDNLSNILSLANISDSDAVRKDDSFG